MNRETIVLASVVAILVCSPLARCDPTNSFSFRPKANPAAAETTETPACAPSNSAR